MSTTVHNQSQKTQIAYRVSPCSVKVLGVFQIIIGVLCFIVMVASIAFDDIIGFVGHGIWNGILVSKQENMLLNSIANKLIPNDQLVTHL